MCLQMLVQSHGMDVKTAKVWVDVCGHCHVVMQAAQQDLAYAEAVSHRFEAGTALNPARAQAEEQYADSLVLIGRNRNNSKALAIAAESYMNLSPWNYYIQVPGHRPPIVWIRRR